jgi:hypothetical protein
MNTLARFQHFQRNAITRLGGGEIVELELGGAEIVVRDRQFVIPVGVGFRQFDDALRVRQCFRIARGVVQGAELIVRFHARVERQDAADDSRIGDGHGPRRCCRRRRGCRRGFDSRGGARNCEDGYQQECEPLNHAGTIDHPFRAVFRFRRTRAFIGYRGCARTPR